MSQEVKFPKRFSDGSFCVLICLEVGAARESLLNEVEAWLQGWARDLEWHWDMSDGTEVVYYYRDEFKSPPEPVFFDQNEIRIKLEGQPQSVKFWKDWLALRIVPELQAAFPEIIRVKRITDCSDEVL